MYHRIIYFSDSAHSHEHRFAGHARVLKDLSQGLARLLDPLDVAGVDHEHNAVRLRVVVLPDAPDSLPATEVKDGHLKLALLQVNLGKTHGWSHVVGIV